MALGAAALFAYLLWFRIHDLDQRFGLFSDQIRDWNIALRQFGHLPLTGTPSTAGGTTIGPAYYWVLWLIARVFGPWFDYLPHAGGIGLAVLHSAADVFFCYALARHLHSVLLALAIVLFVATAGYDASLAASIWNPPFAVLLVKVALGLTCLPSTRSAWRTAAIAATAWMAVHAHTAGIIVAVPLFAWIGVSAWRHGGATQMGRELLVIAAVVLALQVPWALDQMRATGSETSRILTSVESVVESPGSRLRVVESGRALLRSLRFILFSDAIPEWVVAIAVAIGTGLLAALGRDGRMLTAGPLVLATSIVVFALWQGAFQEVYWYLPVLPSAAITLLGWLARLPPRATTVGAAAILLAIGAAQPYRAREAWTQHTMPYGALLRGTRDLIARGQAVSEVQTTFVVPRPTDPAYLYSLLGGAVEAGAPVAMIDNTGRVTLRR